MKSIADAVVSSQVPATTGTIHTRKVSDGQQKFKNPRAKANHPSTSEMVNNAIKCLKERDGYSLQAISVDAEKLSPLIKKYLKDAVASGGCVQTKRKSGLGFFKLLSGLILLVQERSIIET